MLNHDGMKQSIWSDAECAGAENEQRRFCISAGFHMFRNIHCLERIEQE